MNNFSLEFNSIDLTTYGVTVVAPFLPYFSEIQAPLVGLALQDGGISAPSRYVSKVMSVPCIVKGSGFANLQSKLDSISSILGQRELSTLKFDIVTDRYWMAKVAGNLNVTPIGPSVASLDIPFLCPDPHAFANSETTVDSGTIPGIIPCTPGGTIETHPVITLDIDADDITYLAVTNDTLDERLEWTSPDSPTTDLMIGDQVIIDCRPSYKTFSIQRAAEEEPTVLMEGVEGVFPQMSPGVENSIIFYVVSADAFSIVWNDRYQ